MFQETKNNAIRIALDILTIKVKEGKDVQKVTNEIINIAINQDNINAKPIEKIIFTITLINSITKEHIAEYGKEACQAYAKALANNAICELNSLNNYIHRLYNEIKSNYNNVIELTNDSPNVTKEDNKYKKII